MRGSPNLPNRIETDFVPFQQARAHMGDQYHAMMRDQIGKFKRQWEGLSVAGEKISGDTAKVTLSCDKGEKVDVDFVKESDGWKIRLLR